MIELNLVNIVKNFIMTLNELVIFLFRMIIIIFKNKLKKPPINAIIAIIEFKVILIFVLFLCFFHVIKK